MIMMSGPQKCESSSAAMVRFCFSNVISESAIGHVLLILLLPLIENKVEIIAKYL